jgi:hypothetical protein
MNELQSAVWSAIRACRWIPGRDETGQPAGFWVAIPIRIVSQ